MIVSRQPGSSADRVSPIRERRRWLAASMLSVLIASCAPTLPAVVRSNGEPRWHRVVTDHFVIESNEGDVDGIKDLGVDLELYYSTLASIPILGKREPPGRTHVVVFASRRHLQWFVNDHAGASFYRKTPLGPVIVMTSVGSFFTQVALKHELAHLFINRFMPNVPDWLDEGLACTMETAKYSERRQKVVVGDYSERLLRQAIFVGQAPVTELVGPWPTDESRTALYGASWLLVTYLMRQDLPKFIDFEVQVSRGVPWTQAWDQTFAVPVTSMKDPLTAYLRRAKFRRYEIEVEPKSSSAMETTTPNTADIHALYAMLYLLGDSDERPRAERLSLARRALNVARSADEDNQRAQWVSARMP